MVADAEADDPADDPADDAGAETRLFVYGTLAPGRPNAHELADVHGDWQPGAVRGQLFPSGWGAAAGYPGLVLDERGPVVPGFVLSSPLLSDHWERLDEFEGDGYDRMLATVTFEDGATTRAYLYVLRGLPPTS
jgi:gamma-glutamylcyclotransferase (GGCT)/AIG2-like uncharacterized protein YtfP